MRFFSAFLSNGVPQNQSLNTSQFKISYGKSIRSTQLQSVEQVLKDGHKFLPSDSTRLHDIFVGIDLEFTDIKQLYIRYQVLR